MPQRNNTPSKKAKNIITEEKYLAKLAGLRRALSQKSITLEEYKKETGRLKMAVQSPAERDLGLRAHLAEAKLNVPSSKSLKTSTPSLGKKNNPSVQKPSEKCWSLIVASYFLSRDPAKIQGVSF